MPDAKERKLHVQPEMLVGISAIVIGICALAVSLYEASLMRSETRASVIPILELSRSYFTDDLEEQDWRLQFQAENVGIGPARIMDFRVSVDGDPKATWNEAMQALLRRDDGVTYGQSTINGRTIPAERVVTMFDLKDTQLSHDIIREFDRLDFEACFCSIFGECWQTSYSSLGASIAVPACSASADSFRE